MKHQFYLKIFLKAFAGATFTLTLYSQTITDYDGNEYLTVPIGNQTWMAENLRTTHYSDGTPLINGTGAGELENLDTTRYYFYYNDSPTNATNYGCLYTWFAAMNQTKGSESNPSGVQGVCPSGWHIPSDAEWQELEVFLGMDPAIANSLSCWADDRSGNFGDLLRVGGESGFEAKYAGIRDIDGNYHSMGSLAEFLTTHGERYQNESVDTYTRLYYIISGDSRLFCHYHGTTAGYSVRCLKDLPSTLLPNNLNNSEFVIYPNPCTENFNINSEGKVINKVVIYSLDAKEIKTILMTGYDNQVPVSGIEHGLYLIKVYLTDSFYTEHLIIE